MRLISSNLYLHPRLSSLIPISIREEEDEIEMCMDECEMR